MPSPAVGTVSSYRRPRLSLLSFLDEMHPDSMRFSCQLINGLLLCHTDPDMLEVGNGGMAYNEYVVHFSLWAIAKVRESFFPGS
jgi:hypothetical protein